MSVELAPEALHLRLPPIADLIYAAELKPALAEALDTNRSLEIDAGEVQNVTSPCLQILVAGMKSFAERDGLQLTITKPSPAFLEAAKTLAIGEALKLGEMGS